MSKIATATFKGASGTAYDFEAWTTDTTFSQVGAVYVFTKRTVGADGKGSHTLLYIGQTDNLANRIPNHEKWSCANKNGVNCICTHRDNSEKSRIAKETDLINANNTPCNKE
jgi:hypothetical protein